MQAVLLGADDIVHVFVNLTGDNDNNHYFLGMELDSETVTGFVASQFRLFFGALIIGLFLSRFLAHIFVRKIARPIEELSETVAKVAQGDLSHEVKLDRKDEIGQLAGAFKNRSALSASAVEPAIMAEPVSREGSRLTTSEATAGSTMGSAPLARVD